MIGKDFKFPELNLKDLTQKKKHLEKQLEKQFDKQLQKIKRQDVGAAAAFMGALVVMLVVATYVICRFAADHAHRNKWRDYEDCGWS